MLPVRVILNVTYSMLIENCDAKQRKELDAQLYGWDDLNKRAESALWNSGGGEG